MQKKLTKRALFSSVVALVLCVTMFIGTTFAWFTDSISSGSNVITSGNLDIEVQYTLGDKDAADGLIWKNLDGAADLFRKGLWEPGHTEVVALKITNKGSLALKYAANMNIVSETKGKTKEGKDIVLSEILTVSTIIQQAIDKNGTVDQNGDNIVRLAFSGENSVDYQNTTAFKDGNVLGKDKELLPGEVDYLIAKVDMAESVGNEANHNNIEIPAISFGINVLATQFTEENDSFSNQYDKDAAYPELETADVWDGTYDISWYSASDTEFTIKTSEQLSGFSQLIKDGKDFEGKTIKLGKDLDLLAKDDNGNPISFEPIGKDSAFKGTFDGQGYKIKNLYQSGWAFGYEWGKYGSIGLFGKVESATIKNFTVEGAEAQIEGGDIGGIVGTATGTCVFENIEIKDSKFGTYNNGLGGIIGWSGKGNYTFKNIKIKENVVLAGLWGSFDSSIGGVVGQGEPGATYNFENVEIACRLDAYNDCTASYDYYNYRMCGMIIGRLEETTVIDGVKYPDTSKYNIICDNVTVNYGDWMNYHYCEPTPGLNGGRGMRVEPGYAYDGLPADYDHSQCVDNHMNLIPFDQIFGGKQLGVKGLKEYSGVTVNYPASYIQQNG